MKKTIIFIFISILIVCCEKNNFEKDYTEIDTISDNDIQISSSITSNIYNDKIYRQLIIKSKISIEKIKDKNIKIGYLYGSNEEYDTINKDIKSDITSTNFYLEKSIFNNELEIITFIKIYNNEINDVTKVSKEKTLLFKKGKEYKFLNNFSYDVIIKKLENSMFFVGDTIIIKGHNFCASGLDISKGSTVNIAGKEHGIILESDSILKTVISPYLSERISKPILKNCGMEITDFGEIEIKKHQTDSITSKKLYPTDTINIYGENFIPELYTDENNGAFYLFNKNGFEVKLNYFQNPSSNSKLISFYIPSNLPSGKLSIKHKQFDDYNIIDDTYQSTTPIITSVSNTQNISLGDTIIVNGNYFIQKNRIVKPRLYIENTEQKLIDFNENQAYFLINNSIGNKTANEQANKLYVYIDEYSKIYGINYYSGWKNRIVEKEFNITTQSPILRILNKKDYYSLKDTLKFEVKNFYYEDNKNNLPYTNSYKLIYNGLNYLLPLKELKGTVNNINSLYVNSGGFGYSDETFYVKSPSELNVTPKTIYENSIVTIQGDDIGYSSNYNGFFDSDCIFMYVETENWGSDEYLVDAENIKLIAQTNDRCDFEGGRRGYLPVISFSENNKKIQFTFNSSYLGRVNNGNFKLKMRIRGEDIYIGDIKIYE